jgi:hypothetical protein
MKKNIHSCPKTISPRRRKERRGRIFIRIPERGILIRLSPIKKYILESGTLFADLIRTVYMCYLRGIIFRRNGILSFY